VSDSAVPFHLSSGKIPAHSLREPKPSRKSRFGKQAAERSPAMLVVSTCGRLHLRPALRGATWQAGNPVHNTLCAVGDRFGIETLSWATLEPTAGRCSNS